MSTAEFFGQYTEAYDKVMSNLNPYRKLLVMHKKALEGKRVVLDSGCGPGELVAELLKNGSRSEVYAIDQNETALKILSRKAHRYGSRLHTLCQDATHIPFENNFFDGVSSMLVLPFMEDPAGYLKEHSRVLKDGGVFVVSGPDEDAKKDVDFIMKLWKEDLERQGIFDRLSEQWNIFEERTIESIKSNVKNWLSIREVSSMLENEARVKIIRAEPNPLYYFRGYVIVAEK